MSDLKAPSSYLWSNWLMLILAAWLFISPWVLPAAVAGAWTWNFWIVAVIAAALAVGALSQVAQWEDWINLALGVWLFVSPWFLGYAGTESIAWNSYIVGALMAVIAIWGIVAARQSSEIGAHG